jgi:flagellar motor switch protein FliN/FliY
MVSSTESPNAADPPDSLHTFALAFHQAEEDNHFLFIRPSSDLLRSLERLFSASSLGNYRESSGSARNLELLLDVEMPVSVSFGSTRLLLKDVAKLTTGSIIELDRSLSEPIQLVVNNCSIARGDVVVVDGKFGVRIKEIMSRHDRLRSLS